MALNLLVTEKAFRKSIEGKEISLVFLENKNGVKVGICNYGARITHFIVPGNEDHEIDIVLGFNHIDDYLSASDQYHGAVIGRFSNRIKAGKFTLNEKDYQLEINNGPNSLHGGEGFQKKVWDIVSKNDYSISLRIISFEGDDGFPGDLKCMVTYTLMPNNELKIEYEAVSSEDTIINLTNHAYFNLNGEGNGNILRHEVRINASHFVPIDENAIPIGGINTVKDTPFDFTSPKEIGEHIKAPHHQLKMGNGYDHSFVLNKNSNDFSFAAIAKGDKTGIILETSTTEPGMQFYSGNFLDGTLIGKSGKPYKFREGFCLETQHHPDSPNRPEFPTTVLRAGEMFKSYTVYKVIF